MKIFERFQKKLTIDYVKKFLRGKGLITDEGDEHYLSFRLCDKNWEVFCDGNRALVRIYFDLDDSIDVECMLRANNAINNGKWLVKCSIRLERSEETGKDERVQVFSFESIINRASDFDEFYEIAVNVIWESLEEQAKLYHKFLEEKSKGMQKIGFLSNASESSVTTPTAQTTPRKIGFSL